MQNTEMFERMVGYMSSRFPKLDCTPDNIKFTFYIDYETFSDTDLEDMANHFGLKVGEYGDDIVPLEDPENRYMYVYKLGKRLFVYRDYDMDKVYT